MSASDDEMAETRSGAGGDEDKDEDVGGAGGQRSSAPRVTADEDAMLLDSGHGGLSALLQLEVLIPSSALLERPGESGWPGYHD